MDQFNIILIDNRTLLIIIPRTIQYGKMIYKTNYTSRLHLFIPGEVGEELLPIVSSFSKQFLYS